MEKFLFVHVLLERLADTRFCYRSLSMILRVLSGLFVLFSFATFFQAGKLTFSLPAQSILGGLLFELFFVLAVYAVVHAILIRARDIESLDPAGPWALRASTVLSRLVGEIYFLFVTLVSMGAGLFVWFTATSHYKVLGSTLRSFFPAFHEDASFLGGIQFMVSGILLSLAVLIVSYALAEVLTLVLRKNAEGYRGEGGAGGGRPGPSQAAHRSRFGV
jgi:hypothetical protein